jgi:hypothetical protein
VGVAYALSILHALSDEYLVRRTPHRSLLRLDETAVDVSVTVSPDGYDSSFEGSVPGGETVVREKFVTVESGDVITLVARLGDEGDPVEFEFLPAGGDSRNVPPEVARLKFETPVEASATWTAITGR